MNSTTMNKASRDARCTPASTLYSSRDTLKHDIEFDNNDEQQPTKRARLEEVPVTPLKNSTNHPQRKGHDRSKPILFTTSRIESSTSHISGGLTDDSRGRSSPSPPTHDQQMIESVAQNIASTASRDVLKEKDQKLLEQIFQQKDDEISLLKIKLEVREEFDIEAAAREAELKDTVENYRLDAEYWKERSSCGLESCRNLQEKYGNLEFKLEAVSTELKLKNETLEAEHEAVKADLQEKYTLAAKHETEKAELQEKYDTLEDKYKTLKIMGINQASYTPEFISVNHDEPLFTDEELAEMIKKLADKTTAKIQKALDDLSNNDVKEYDTPIQSIEVVPEDMRFSKLPKETSHAVSRSSSPKIIGSSIPLRYVTPSVTPISPDSSNTHESNCRLWNTPDRPIFPGPIEESP